MNIFEQNFKGKEIIKIYRIDELDTYSDNGLQGIFLMLDENNGLLIRYLGSESGIDVRFISYEEMYEISGSLWSESDINELQQDDTLTFLVGEHIANIEILEAENESLIGKNFIIKKEKLSIIIYTEHYKLIFNGNNDPVLSINKID